MKLSFLFFALSAFSLFGQENQVTTVDSVELDRYTGKWYEIAKIPNSFQDHCVKNTTAFYKLNDEGEIIVINSCLDSDNETDEAEGLAKIVDNSSNSKLKVSFVSLFGWHLFWGDYWILGLDEDYRYAAVGTPSRKYGWILSRTNKLPEADLERCFQIFERNGYSREIFEFTMHD
jgi:apolipoprotein D and lipocalin family protein